MGSSQRRIKIVVHGAVQGVFFRATCRQEARQRGVSGWVRNAPDGTVEAVFEGSDHDVTSMAAWAEKGPPEARVERVEVMEEPVEGLTEFVIRRD
ncbi:acylphosphatase [Phytoactinopolyspora alkaliphila]|uniref:Acylphosphatase n=1 Tax=Phytoactinopolyspora alkaliphila TaxID=1783498 RepID=A0A6N9YHE5_9ACTN|nr:acylphosphatase [Phytoactinopolyspora alkaliphila]NED94289.1 acylphosphatase [Phytoactinopolyspora alkaliphila]